MIPYCAFAVVWTLWTLLLTALELAPFLRKVFKARVAAPVEAPAAREGAVLEYASAATIRPTLLQRRPLLAVLLVLVPTSLFPLTYYAIPILVWAQFGSLFSFALVAMVGASVTLAGMVVLGMLALRRRDGVPAAALWSRKRAAVRAGVGLMMCAVVLVLLDYRAKSYAAWVTREADATSQSLYEPVPVGTENAAALYPPILESMGEAPDWDSRWFARSSYKPTAPPPLSDAQRQAVPRLRAAAALPGADWGIDPRYTVNTTLPHLTLLRQGGNVLRLHAALEAQDGRIDEAVADIRALRGMARHASGQTIVEALVATGLEALAVAAVEDALPHARADSEVDALIPARDPWLAELRVRALRGEGAQSLRNMESIIYNGPQIPRLAPHRFFLMERDMEIVRIFYRDLVAIAAIEDLSDLARQRIVWAPRRDVMLSEGLFAELACLSVERTWGTLADAVAAQQVCEAAIEIRRESLRSGRLIERLEDLPAAREKPALFMDPFTGKPLLIKRHSPDDLTVYSVGCDLNDDSADLRHDVGVRVALRPVWQIDRERADAAEQSEKAE
jgi:hypothetical protein